MHRIFDYILMGSIPSLPAPPPQTTNGFTIISQGSVPEQTILLRAGKYYTFKRINPSDPYTNYYIVGLNTHENEFYGSTEPEYAHNSHYGSAQGQRPGAFLARDARQELREAPKASQRAPFNKGEKPGFTGHLRPDVPRGHQNHGRHHVQLQDRSSPPHSHRTHRAAKRL